MPEDNYASISVPIELWSRVKALPLRKLGYSSPTEVARQAIREKCEELEGRHSRRREL